MAGELAIYGKVVGAKGNLSVVFQPPQISADMAGDKANVVVQAIPTTAGGTALTMFTGLTGAGGWAFFRNLDATNDVQIGVQVSATFYPLLVLKAGEYAIFRVAVTTIYALALVGAVNLQCGIIEP